MPTLLVGNVLSAGNNKLQIKKPPAKIKPYGRFLMIQHLDINVPADCTVSLLQVFRAVLPCFCLSRQKSLKRP